MKGGKKKGGKKQQQQAQKAKESKPKKSSDVKSASVVKLTPAIEEHARKVLEGVVLEEESVSVGSRMTVEKAAKKYAEIYTQLLDHGFQKGHIEQSMEALPGGCTAINVAMDWLMLNVSAEELPQKFTNKMHAKGPVQIISKRPQEMESDAAPAIGMDCEDSTDTFKSDIDQAKEDEKKRLEEEKRKQDEKKSKGEQDAQRDWILKYMEQESSSQDSDEEGVDPLADYDIWSDPREVERRKQERKKGKLPLEVRQKLIAEELVKMKQMAADAKAEKDKARQKEAGSRIRELKSEMAEIGMTDAMAEALVKPQETEEASENMESPAVDSQENFVPAEGSVGALDLNEPEATQENSEEDFSFGFPGFDDEEETKPVEDVNLKEPIEKSEEKSNPAEEEFDLGMGMFSEELEWEAPEVAAKPLQPEKEEIIPWGMKRVSRSQVKMTKPQKAVSQVEMQRLPKSVLSRHCQQHQWGQPSFEKLMEVSEGYRYAVSVEVRAKKKDKKVQSGKRRFQVSSYQDGWATIQEAQNAAATVALIYLIPDQQLQHTLPSPYKELYIETKKEEAALLERTQAGEQDWDDFVEQLAKQKFSSEFLQKSNAGNLGRHLLDEQNSSELQEVSNERIITRDQHADVSLRKAMQNFHASKSGRDWSEKRSSLPVLQIREKVVQVLKRGNAVVVCGDTGCGKTTQVPQYIFESACLNGEASGCSIVCTQPRRLAAVSVSQRVADEMGQPPPGKKGSLLGYHVRLDPAVSASTRINFCTTGILLRKLAGDRLLQGISHVVVDEVHERTMQGDFLLAVLRDLVSFRESIGQPLKVVLMSATLDAGLFSSYFDCPVLTTEGRTFPVEHHFLEDVYSMTDYKLDPESPAAMRGYGRGDLKALHQKKAGTKDKASLVGAGWGDAHAEEENSFVILNPYYDPDEYRGWEMQVRRNLARVNEDRIDYEVLEKLIVCIDKLYEEEGSILVFLPGMGEINQLYGMLSPRSQFDPYWLIRLHSSLTPEEQKRAFEIPPKGTRKVVISTNIAETSLTIPDVVFVIESGKLKERRFDAGRGIAMLVEDWVAQASAKQRKGRAGRVRPGQCFSLYTRIRFEKHMKPYQKPEIMRMPLEEIILQVHSLKLGNSMDFMGKLVQPPENVAVRKALENLVAIGAIKVEKTGKESLTPLGKHLANLPVDARIGKLLVWASCFGCLSPALTIAAALSGRSIFKTGPDQQNQANIAMKKIAAPGSKTIASGQQSDHLMVVAAYDGWRNAHSKGGWRMAKQYTNERELHIPTLESVGELRMQFARVLAEGHLVRNDSGRGHGDASWVDSIDKPWNRHMFDPAVIKALLCGALYPNLAVMHESRNGVAEWADIKNAVSIHKSSINSGLKSKEVLHPYVVFLEKVKTHSLMLRDCTVVSPLSLMLFGGTLNIRHEEAIVLVDNWIKVNVAGDIAVLMKKMRVALDGLISQKLDQPNKDFSDFDSQILSTLVSLLRDEAATAEKRL